MLSLNRIHIFVNQKLKKDSFLYEFIIIIEQNSIKFHKKKNLKTERKETQKKEDIYNRDFSFLNNR